MAVPSGDGPFGPAVCYATDVKEPSVYCQETAGLQFRPPGVTLGGMTFQRARSAEQREERRRTILDTAAAMLQEMPVADVSLNELSRRVGLAKSNVLRYFDSREAVLLELLARASREWLSHLATELPSVVRSRAAFGRRAEQLATAISASLAERPVLCDLMSAQAAVLEHNVSVEAVTR